MNTAPVSAGPRASARSGPLAAMAAALLIYGAICGACASAQAADAGVSGAGAAGTHVLEAADHAELSATVSASGVIRIALPGDRVARVIRAPGGFRVEHEPASGDLYLHPPVERPAPSGPAAGAGAALDPAVLFIGTERGFTYRLSLMPALSGASQILIRNPAAMASATPDRTGVDDDRVGALVGLIRAVARREPLPGHAIDAGGAAAGTRVSGLTVIETWRGTGAFPRPRFTALLLEVGTSASGGAEGAADLAGTIGPVAALWLAAPGTGPSGGRLAVAVRDGAAGDDR